MDKLVTRLLDIIQQQQRDLAKSDPIAEPSPQSLPSQTLLEKKPGMVQVAELRSFETLPPSDTPQIVGPTDIRSTIRQNRIFFLLAGITFVGTLIFAFKPQSPEIARLSAQIARDEQAFRERDAEQQQITTAHNGEIVSLQQKLKDTEDALSQNEKALIDEQSALRQLTQSPSGEPADAPLKAVSAPVNQAHEAKDSIDRIRLDLNKARTDLVSAREAYIANVRALAQNRLAVYTIQGAEQAMDPAAKHTNTAEKQWRDFVDPEGRPFVDASPEDLPQYQVIGEPEGSTVEALRNFEKKELGVLKLCLSDLRTFQDRIGEKQKELAATESLVRTEEAKLLELQRLAKESAIDSRIAPPSHQILPLQDSDAKRH